MKIFHFFLAWGLTSLLVSCAQRPVIIYEECFQISGIEDSCACGKKVYEKCREVKDYDVNIGVPK